MRVEETELPGVLRIETRLFHDARGHFREFWNERRYQEAGIAGPFVQDNVSASNRGVLRGLHYQWPHPQAKLIGVLEGRIWDVAVDVRPWSQSFGRWVAEELSAESGRELWIPEGFAHGFVVLSERAVVAYKCTDYYHPESERTLLWSDPVLGITWPVEQPILSDKDRQGLRLDETPADHRPIG